MLCGFLGTVCLAEGLGEGQVGFLRSAECAGVAFSGAGLVMLVRVGK